MAHKTKSIDYMINEIDLSLVDVGIGTGDYRGMLDSALHDADIDLYDIREIEPDIFDIDCNDYTITIYKYDTINDLPRRDSIIMLGSTFYMFKEVEVAEPTFIGMCDIVEIFDENYNHVYGIKAS